MSQTQSLRKKNAADNNSAQPLQRNRVKNDSEALDKKNDSAAEPDAAPLQKKAYRTAQDEPRVQTKLSVSTPGDSHEQEADRVADEVVSRSLAAPANEENKLNPGSTKPENNATNPQSLQTKISRMEEPAPATTEVPQPETEVPASAETATDNEQGVSAEVEQQISGLRGQGAQLPEQMRTEMESQFNHDFSSVSIHTDSTADTLCKQLSARAFTVGSDIFFASGEYAPDSQEGKRLLAHELTHVVQQGSGVTRKIMRERVESITEDSATPGTYSFDADGVNYQYKAQTSPKELIISKVRIPEFKKTRHATKYNQMKPFYVRKGDRNTNQNDNWKNNVGAVTLPSTFNEMSDSSVNPYFFRSDTNQNFTLFGSKSELTPKVAKPYWDEHHVLQTFQVDHAVEDQLGGNETGAQRPEIDNIDLSNYELLERSANGSSGSGIAREIGSKIQNAIDSFTDRDEIGRGNRRIARSVEHIKQNYKVQFADIDTSGSLASHANGNIFWSVADIRAGRHLQNFHVLTEEERAIFSDASNPQLFCSPTGGVPVRAPTGEGPYTDLWPRVKPRGPLRVAAAGAVVPVDAYSSSQNAGSAGVTARYPSLDIAFVPVPALGSSVYRIDKTTTLANAMNTSSGVFQSLSLPGMSPLQIDDLDLDPAVGFLGQGKLLPTVPLFRDANIDIVIRGAEIRLQKTFDIGEVNVPAPFEVKYATVTLFASSTNGLGIEGAIGIAIDKIGDCTINAELSTGGGLNIAGQFTFDKGLFSGINATVTAAYRRQDIFNEADHGHWSVGGQIIVPGGKIKGVERASVNLSYSDEEGFRAHGEASLSVPGVERGTIDVTHTEEDGITIGGRFNLRQGNGIRSGFVNARMVEKQDGSGYEVTASGEAEPDIPGVNSKLIINYNDGAFTAEANADYSRGMLSGSVNAGVTNRTVNADGSLSETAAEGNPLVIYGGGQLTLQIAPWLQGTAGVRFAPNGEVTVTGEIGLPSQLEIFARKEINKSIFNIAIQAPIFPGIVAEVGGGLSATAGIGPGVIDQLRLGITYNPAHEDQTRITGDAHLNIPANAGLRLSVRAGIGLGITGASATGGLDIGGTLGIEGAAEAGVHVEWTPATGLDIRTELAVHAQPSFTFDIGGYVSVRALGFSVYDNRWQFASYTFGSDYRFGIRLPIHYHEGEPFDISLDDVQFEVPDIDTNQLLRGLIARIA